VARKAPSENGQDPLAKAMALLINNQAAFVAEMAEINRIVGYSNVCRKKFVIRLASSHSKREPHVR
jgi:hypothetical protein